MSQRTVLAAIAGGVTLFALGYVAYVLVLGDFFAANGMPSQAQPVLWAIGIGELVLSSLVTYIFARWAGISTFGGGLQGGAVVGALTALGMGLILFGAAGMLTLTAVVVDTIVSAIRYGIAGGVIGAMLGRT